MFKVSRQVEYAMLALQHMKRIEPGQVVPVRELCRVQNIPFDVISRALQRLAKHEIVHATRGATGGYHIVGDLTQISLYDLVTIVDGAVEVVPCLSGPGRCKCGTLEDCDIASPMVHLNARLIAFFKTISLLELLEMAQQPDHALLTAQAQQS